MSGGERVGKKSKLEMSDVLCVRVEGEPMAGSSQNTNEPVRDQPILSRSNGHDSHTATCAHVHTLCELNDNH